VFSTFLLYGRVSFLSKVKFLDYRNAPMVKRKIYYEEMERKAA
jgi:hypothetical protein